MAYKYPVVNVAIAADLVEEIRSLPMPERTATKRTNHLLRVGLLHYVKAMESEGETKEVDA